ncbi:unnamed protein product [Rotaria sordida]|uniref:Uncharacterized protein n=1 Tax=Rotaria sordida TaxID=392033 RepID=A0A814X9B3_9BILA|nr:unnamed protein product [Rotaria sordida]CAF3791383.1 unnamed protein product [Rotaria sordida]
MLKIIPIFIVSIGLQVVNANLDLALHSFLTLTKRKSLVGNKTDAIENLYNLYKIEFNRNSQRKSDDNLRFISFNNTLHDILDDYRQGEKTYTLGLNDHADWTEDEWRILRNGFRLPKGNLSNINVKPGDRLLTWKGRLSKGRTIPPTSYDLTKMVVSGTTVPLVLSIKDQGRCGSCYAFAFISLLEFQYAVQLKKSASLSEQQIVDCSYKDGGCGGGYFTDTFDYFKNNNYQVNGAPYYPYRAVQGNCGFRSNGAGGVIFGRLGYWNAVTNSATAAANIQQALVNYGVIYVGIYVGSDTDKRISSIFDNYKTGIIQISECLTSVEQLNHAVVIVGY